MYEIHIESEEFREKRTVQQHQMVNQVRGLWGLPWGTGGERRNGCEGAGAAGMGARHPSILALQRHPKTPPWEQCPNVPGSLGPCPFPGEPGQCLSTLWGQNSTGGLCRVPT